MSRNLTALLLFASLCALSGVSLLGACATSEPVPDKPVHAAVPVSEPPPKPAAANLPMPAGLDESAMDPTVDPCDDFYRYACGGWIAKTEIPPDRPRWTRGFISIDERNKLLLKDILEQTAAGHPPEGTPYAEKLADFWSTCIDEPKLEGEDKTLQRELKALEKVKSVKDLAPEVGRLQARGITPLFHYGSQQDFKDATQMIGVVDQGGLGLPDRDYYLKDEPAKMKEIRELYQKHVAAMFSLAGDKPEVAAKKAEVVMAIETELAKASLSRVDRRDPEKIYHRIDRKGLKETSPDFGWDAFMKAVGSPDVQALNVTWPDFFKAVDGMLKKFPIDQWRTYLAWHLIMDVTPALPKRFQDERFQFTSKALTGAKEDMARWKKCVGFTDQGMGEALDVAFVAKTFGPEGKATTSMMVKEIEQAFEKNLDSLPWMDPPTKEKAVEKARAIFNKIGYPDKWRDYGPLKTNRSSFLENLLAAEAFEQARELSKIGKPVDRTEWEMTPATVNAYYNATMNEIVFPAGILQPPFFNREATAAVNFGSMGMVVGHETTHGFDDQGRHFDAKGNLTDWWTDASAKAFVERAACVKKQFDDSIAIDELHVNGALTLGENVADLGGLKFAHAAMRSYVDRAKDGAGPPSRFNAEQQFFLGYAQSWCSKSRPEDARNRVTVDPHAPPFLRVDNPLRNLPEFAEAFGCKAPKKMISDKPCAVW